MEPFTPVKLKFFFCHLHVIVLHVMQIQFRPFFFLPLQLNVFIRSSLQSLKEKISQLRDLLLRDVSMHQMYPWKHLLDLPQCRRECKTKLEWEQSSAMQLGLLPHSTLGRFCHYSFASGDV